MWQWEERWDSGFPIPDTPLALAAAQVQNKLRNKVNGDFIDNKAHSSNFGLFVYVIFFLFILLYVDLK